MIPTYQQLSEARYKADLFANLLITSYLLDGGKFREISRPRYFDFLVYYTRQLHERYLEETTSSFNYDGSFNRLYYEFLKFVEYLEYLRLNQLDIEWTYLQHHIADMEGRTSEFKKWLSKADNEKT